MSSKTLKFVVLACLSWMSTAHADCVFPKAPDVPDGKTASVEVMTTAVQAFKAYNEAVVAFGACLDEDLKSKSQSSSQLLALKTMQTKKHNAAVSELQHKMAQFNEQIKVFKARG